MYHTLISEEATD